ncbi:MAG TPA: sugar transferase [Cyclobacteriaceae bacterium]|nr:sugar transferase [Cyclobacteriaceae bacterium]
MKHLYHRYYKRLFDIFFAIFLLIGLSWFILLVIILYLLTFQLPIIFSQMRIGRNGTTFVMYKFRTLKNMDAPLQQRRFWLGDFLRATNADELPQLWNVLLGEMSLVGPRPMPLEYGPLFTQEQNTRHLVRPGITGYAQVYGKNSISWEQKFNYDLEYVKHITFWTDVKILMKTITLVLSMKRDVSLMEEKFKG